MMHAFTQSCGAVCTALTVRRESAGGGAAAQWFRWRSYAFQISAAAAA